MGCDMLLNSRGLAFVVVLGIDCWVSSSATAQCGRLGVTSGIKGNPDSGGCACGFVDYYIMPCDGSVTPPTSEGLCHISTYRVSGDPASCVPCDWPVNCSDISLDYQCDADRCGPSQETCDGADNAGDGLPDDGACDPNGPCQNYRTDPVHVGTGAYLSDPITDVRFQGGSAPIEFVRSYTSMDGWLRPQTDSRERARLGRGWFHTYDQALYSANRLQGPELPGSAGTVYVQRTATGRGRRFTCPGDPGTGAVCTIQDGSQDALLYDSFGGFWEIRHGGDLPDGRVTRFDGEGELLSHGWFDSASGDLLDGWEVVRYLGGPLDRRINYVEDQWGRRLVFKHQQAFGRTFLESSGRLRRQLASILQSGCLHSFGCSRECCWKLLLSIR